MGAGTRGAPGASLVVAVVAGLASSSVVATRADAAPAPEPAPASEPAPAPEPATASEPAPASARAKEPAIRVTWPWLAAQLLPSPQWTIPERGGVLFGMRWQVTAVLISLRMSGGLSPWRFFVVEPNVRSWGSIEVFLSPEIAIASGPAERALVGRAGARLYVPLAHAGDYLSMSGGASAFLTWQGVGGAIEVGLYTFAGMLGVQVTHAPDPRARSTTFTLAVRYF